MRTTIDLPDPLFRQIKARAALEGCSMKDYVIARLRHDLESTQASPAREWAAWMQKWKQSGRALAKSTPPRKGRKANTILFSDRNAR